MFFQPQERGPPTLTRGLLECETELPELSAEFVVCCPSFQHTGLLVTSPALGFLPILLPLQDISWPPPCRSCTKVVSASLNPSHTPQILGKCVISLVLSLKRWSSATARRQTMPQLSHRSVLQLHVTAQFYLENKGKYILEARHEGMLTQKT